MIPVLINNPLFRGITPEKLSANLEEIRSVSTPVLIRKGKFWHGRGMYATASSF